MAQQGTPFVIPFGPFGMVAHPNRWRSSPGELTLAQNVVFDNDLLQQDPASAYYHFEAGVNTLEPLFWSGSVSGGDNGSAAAAWFSATPTAALAGVSVATGSLNPGTPWAIVLTGGVAVGALHAVTASREAGAGGITAMTDSQGNTYTQLVTALASGIQTELWVSLVTTALLVGDTLTLTLTDGTADWNVIGAGYTGVLSATPIYSDDGTVGGGALNVGATGGIEAHVHRYPLLGIAVAGITNPATTVTGAGGWTQASTITTAAHATFQYFRLFVTGTSILAQIEWHALSDRPADVPATTLTGTVSTSRGSKTVTGVATVFNSELRIGDRIIIGGEAQIIATITGTLSLTTFEQWESTNTGVAYQRASGPSIITALLAPTAPNSVGFAITKETPQSGGGGVRGKLNGVGLYSAANAARRSVQFVVGGRNPDPPFIPQQRLFCFTGVEAVLELRGDANLMAAIPTPPVDWGGTPNPYTQPVGGIVHQDSLVGFGNWNDPHRVYFSTTADQGIFIGTDAIQMRIGASIGERLYAAAHYQGVLFFFKYPTGIFYLDDTPVDRFQWGNRTRSAALGCAPSPHAVLEIDDDVLFMAPDGHFHLLSAVNTLGGTRDSDLTRLFGLQQWTVNHVDIASLEQLSSVYDPTTKTAWFGFRSVAQAAAGLPDNDQVIRFDFAQRTADGAIRVSTSTTWVPNSLCLKRRQFNGTVVPLIGEIGQAQLIVPDPHGTRTDRDWITDTDVTIGIPISVESAERDCSESEATLRHIRKRFSALELVLNEPPTPAQAVTIELVVDGVSRETLTFAHPTDRRILSPLNCGDGYSIQPKLRTTGEVAGELQVLGLVIYATPTSTSHARTS